MAQLIATIILIGSIFGIGTIVFRKIPALVGLSEFLPVGEGLVLKFKKRIKEMNFVKNFSYELFLQKILTKIRILILRTENMTFLWLQKLRENYKKRTLERTDKYWEKLKKAISPKK